MNNEQLSKAKQLYNAISELISNPTIQISLLKQFPGMKNLDPDKILLLDSFQFMGYIANADGEISQREVNVMNYITGLYLPLEAVQELITDKSIPSGLTTTPLTVKILCAVENFLYQNDAAPDGDSLMNTLIIYFQTIGSLISEADNNATSIEYTRINTYINIIKEYAAENTLSPFFEY